MNRRQALGLGALWLTGCGGSAKPDPTTRLEATAEAELHEGVVVLSDGVRVLSETQVELTGSDLPPLVPGMILFSAQGEGFARKVVSVERHRALGSTILTTAQATLEELFKQAVIAFHYVLDHTELRLASGVAGLRVRRNSASGTLNYPIRLDFSNTTLYDSGNGASVRLDGPCYLAAGVRGRIEIQGGKLLRAEFHPELQAKVDVQVVSQVETSLDRVIPLVVPALTPVQIPVRTPRGTRVFVVFSLQLGLSARLAGTLHGRHRFRLVASLGLDQGTRWEGGHWKTPSSAATIPPTLDFSEKPTLDTVFRLTPLFAQAELRLLGVVTAGAELSLPAVELTADRQNPPHPDPGLKVRVVGQLRGRAVARAQVLGRTLADFDAALTLSPEWVLFDHLFRDTGEAEVVVQ